MRLSARKCGTQSQKACQSINEPSTGLHRDNYNDNDNDMMKTMSKAKVILGKYP